MNLLHKVLLLLLALFFLYGCGDKIKGNSTVLKNIAEKKITIAKKVFVDDLKDKEYVKGEIHFDKGLEAINKNKEKLAKKQLGVSIKSVGNFIDVRKEDFVIGFLNDLDSFLRTLKPTRLYSWKKNEMQILNDMNNELRTKLQYDGEESKPVFTDEDLIEIKKNYDIFKKYHSFLNYNRFVKEDSDIDGKFGDLIDEFTEAKDRRLIEIVPGKMQDIVNGLSKLDRNIQDDDKVAFKENVLRYTKELELLFKSIENIRKIAKSNLESVENSFKQIKKLWSDLKNNENLTGEEKTKENDLVMKQIAKYIENTTKDFEMMQKSDEDPYMPHNVNQ